MLIGAIPAMREFTTLMSDENTTQNLQTLAQAAVQLATWMGKAASETASFSKWMGEELAARINGIAKDDVVRLQQRLEAVNEMLDSTNIGAIDFFKGEFYSKSDLEAEAAQLKKDIEAALKAQEIKAPVTLDAPTTPEGQKLSDKQISLIATMTAKIEELENQILSGENAVPLQERIDALKKQIEETKNATNGNKPTVDQNTKATQDNTEKLRGLSDALGAGDGKADTETLKTSLSGDKMSKDFERVIENAKRDLGPTSRAQFDEDTFRKVAGNMIEYYGNMGGYDVDKMREQVEAILTKSGEEMGRASKEGMKEAAQELTGGEGKSIGSITITVKSDNGETSGEVTGDTAFLSKLASTLQSVSTAV